jgi:hypothetical protein
LKIRNLVLDLSDDFEVVNGELELRVNVDLVGNLPLSVFDQNNIAFVDRVLQVNVTRVAHKYVDL